MSRVPTTSIVGTWRYTEFLSVKENSFSQLSPDDEALISSLQRGAFAYFEHETNPETGLTADSSRGGSPASIAATGMALACYPVSVERGCLKRASAIRKTLAALRFFVRAPHGDWKGTNGEAIGRDGFYFHFLDIQTGRRIWKSELSSIDTALLLAGALTARAYFDLDTADEREIRELGEVLYRRADWNWMRNEKMAVSHGWKPKRGFLPYCWTGYSEALLLYILGLGSPTHALPPESYAAFVADFKWKKIYGHEYVYAGPLFIHQFSHLWLDLAGIQDAFMREKNSDYFQNSRRATLVHREYALRNPRQFAGYCEQCWGLTACDGPGPEARNIKGRKRRFYDYHARGVPFGPDDGTIAPWVAATSLPFAPEEVLPAIRHFQALDLGPKKGYGFEPTFNPTYPDKHGSEFGWVSDHHLAINQGPLVLMLENFLSGMIWQLMRECPFIVAGLQRAGFEGGWLENANSINSQSVGPARVY